jgi:hypothetical protein
MVFDEQEARTEGWIQLCLDSAIDPDANCRKVAMSVEKRPSHEAAKGTQNPGALDESRTDPAQRAAVRRQECRDCDRSAAGRLHASTIY